MKVVTWPVLLIRGWRVALEPLSYGDTTTGMHLALSKPRTNEPGHRFVFVGLRWSRKVWDAPAGPYVEFGRYRLDARTLSWRTWRDWIYERRGW